MLCAMERLSLKSVEEVCKNARRIAVLENVVNPTDAEKETTAAEETAEVPETKEDVEESKKNGCNYRNS